MASVHFWTEAPESFIAPTYCGVEAIKLSGRVISTKNTQTYFFSSININKIHNSLPDANTKINFKSNSTKNKPVYLLKNLKQNIPRIHNPTPPSSKK